MRPTRRRHPGLGSARRPFVLATLMAILKERFDRWKLPHLRLEAEATPGSIEQLTVRVQSFIESLL